MLIEDWRPPILIGGITWDNSSPDRKVLFRDEDHKYFHISDIEDNVIRSFEDSTYRFRSPTGVLKEFYEEFDTVYQSEKYVIKHKLSVTAEELRTEWKAKGDSASADGTLLHAYGEALWNKWDMPRPNHAKTTFVEEMTAELKEDFVLAKTELLLYSTKLRLAGQVDLLLKKKGTDDLYLMDYKFIEKLDMKSFYNFHTKKYKMMYGPFRFLQDCSYIHYSIQMALYKMLMPQALQRRLKSKTLLVVTADGWEKIEGEPMTIWVDKWGVLQAKYSGQWGRFYDSSKDDAYLSDPYFLISEEEVEELLINKNKKHV